MAFCASHQLANIPLWMVSSCGIVVKDVIVQHITPLTSQLSYLPSLGPTLGTRFSLSWAYYPFCRGSLDTGPTVVDREQNTITDINDGIYSRLRCEFQDL